MIRSHGIAVCGRADTSLGAEDRDQLRSQAGLELVEIPDVGHSLELDDDLTASIEILAFACQKLEKFSL